MAKIEQKAALQLFEQMMEEHWAYEWGKAEKGLVDCAGALVYLYKQNGLSLYHGSNAIARSEAVELLPISAAKPGMLAFKARASTEKGYALPDKYKPGGKSYNGDLLDYYHVGLVDAAGKQVLNAASKEIGFTRSQLSASKGWDYVAYARRINYGETNTGDDGMQTMVVTADSGGTVNLRARPDKSASVLAKVPIGEAVQVLSLSGGWATVQRDGITGYMMEQYLKAQEAVSAPGSVEARLAALEARVTALEGGKG